MRPGDIIKFDVDTYINSYTAGHNSGWYYNNDTQNTGNINVYKDGHIYYKDSSGTVHEVTKLYYKDSSGAIKKGRYATVKDGNGASHVIDVYTTKYE